MLLTGMFPRGANREGIFKATFHSCQHAVPRGFSKILAPIRILALAPMN